MTNLGKAKREFHLITPRQNGCAFMRLPSLPRLPDTTHASSLSSGASVSAAELDNKALLKIKSDEKPEPTGSIAPFQNQRKETTSVSDQLPAYSKTVPKARIIIKEVRNFARSPGATSWFATTRENHGRIACPPLDVIFPGLQDGDLFVNWVAFPSNCQVWRYKDLTWNPVKWGEEAPETGRLLVITHAEHEPSWVKKSTYRTNYKSGCTQRIV